jgi:hypothetical protein
MTRRKLWLISVSCLLTAVFAAVGWIGWLWLETRSEEAACDCGPNPVDAERFAYWNPLRSKEPERKSNELMRQLQSGECENIPAMQPYCERERRFKIVSWIINGRDGGAVRLWVTRTDGVQKLDDPVWVYVEKRGSSWKIDKVSLYY